MEHYNLARSREILRKRVRRLLQLDRTDDTELTAHVLPFLRGLGTAALIGGAIRDLALGGKQSFHSDLDFVVYGKSRDEFRALIETKAITPNKFGGYAVGFHRWKVDVWHIDDTWAKTAGHVQIQRPRDLLKCTFFDWDAALFDVSAETLIIPDDYLLRLRMGVMDIRLEPNPNPAGSMVRALRRAALWQIKFGPRLTAFSRRILRTVHWEELVDLDQRAFHNPVLRHLDYYALVEALASPMPSAAGSVTLPVRGWARQPDFFEPTSLSPADTIQN